MDAPEADQDVKLQKLSSDLLAQFDQALAPFLRKPDGRGGTVPRSRVRSRELFNLTSNILDTFQELPQLLDPHLPKWIPFLSQTYLQLVQARGDHRARARRSRDGKRLIIPAELAICKLLYTFCKIRGEKVIVRFLNVEARYLELLVTEFENAEEASARKRAQDGGDEDGAALDVPVWEWEQRYIVLLWISHLLLAPFDLSTISSVDREDMAIPHISNFTWPDGLPGIAVRVLPLGIKYLASPGRERDAAKALMVRISMRRDMQDLGLLSSLMQWALRSLRPAHDAAPEPNYFYLGTLSFLAGALRAAADTSDMNAYLERIFETVSAIATDESCVARSIYALASARRMLLKVMRAVVVSLLKQGHEGMETEQVTETAIGHLLESLADNDTPVRLAASKSLSIITLTLDPDMASQVVEAVLEALNRNVLWSKPSRSSTASTRSLSAVNPLEWHGLVLTLSHLLYRRSPPAAQLPDIIRALLLGLVFEQRSTANTSIGSNVRDAACFGIWAIARRYTTSELLAIPTAAVATASTHPQGASVLQVLATELVTTACLDPAGNIRRGSSAALQELIGRHPDTVEKGIWVVQRVDYHAVARRSRALQDVALAATSLSQQYDEAILDGILGWRGIGDPDAPSRRNAAKAFGMLTAQLATTASHTAERLMRAMDQVFQSLRQLATRQVEERHGLLLCFAALVQESARMTGSNTMSRQAQLRTLEQATSLLEELKDVKFRRPELVAEGGSRVVVALVPLLQSIIADDPSRATLSLQSLLEPPRSDALVQTSRAIDALHGDESPLKPFVVALQGILPLWLARSESETVEIACRAGLTMLLFSPPSDRESFLASWSRSIRTKPTSGVSALGDAYLHTLALAQPLAQAASQQEDGNDMICQAFLDRWAVDHTVDARVAVLQSLTRSHMLRNQAQAFTDLLVEGLADYTTDARGDIGSHVRVQALRAVRALWADEPVKASERTGFGGLSRLLFRRVFGLAAEKLDRIRPEAQTALALTLQPEQRRGFSELSFSSKAYFQALLELVDSGSLGTHFQTLLQGSPDDCMADLLAGFVTSADTGHEELVVSSRAALVDFCQTADSRKERVSAALLRNLKANQGNDRLIVPTLEIVAFLFHTGLVGDQLDLKSLCLQAQKAGYKTGNVRKLEACIKVYTAVASSGRQHAGVREARKRLGALLPHPWPKVRGMAIDALWVVSSEGENGDTSKLLGVDWGKAKASQTQQLVSELGLV